MLEPGDAIPEVRVWRAPNEAVELRDVLSGSPALVFFYLFDWSGT